jgi:hypothetical protein
MRNNMDRIGKALNNTYVGKEFIYKSKYGRTRGIVQEFIVNESFIMDEDSENALAYLANHKKGRGDMEKPERKSSVRYMAFQPTFHIRSTNGVIYDLKDCFFIENNLQED